MKQIVWVATDGRLIVIWWNDKSVRARIGARDIMHGLEIAGAECLGEL
jgi:hypothetical protein